MRLICVSRGVMMVPVWVTTTSASLALSACHLRRSQQSLAMPIYGNVPTKVLSHPIRFRFQPQDCSFDITDLSSFPEYLVWGGRAIMLCDAATRLPLDPASTHVSGDIVMSNP